MSDINSIVRKSSASCKKTVQGRSNSARTGWVSDNWSGYAITGKKNSFRSISAEWVVPYVRPSRTPSYSSAWIGIDGFNNENLIQTGTGHEYVNGSARYYAWWEILPASETVILKPVSPGDRMKASIAKLASGKWLIKLCNLSKGWTFCTKRHYRGQQNSAEWIVEAPSIDGETAKLTRLTPVSFCKLRVNGKSPRLTADDGGVIVQNQIIVSKPGKPNVAGDAFTVRRP
ncbi:G1 family glutamic endopeptidase [Paenibacillus sp. NFR01]|uniref:G1 family glutamic endopeptidase n=1 Tax=Paenibacillus sp. NFR01 TaxID=1566279 RepID=UPI0008B0478F|nr:G1 family glutamic endopeptidase [Paenibacillus sp. NFR01]SES93601.1 Peptidase A4 family protein [Paenibacillus sp. NFR01]